MREILYSRRSIRKFKQIPVTREQVNAILDAALVAPAARNGQILRYCAISSPEKRQEIFQNTAWGGYVQPKRNPVNEVSSPMFYVVVSAANGENPISHHTWADAGAAIENMLLTAVELGLGGVTVGAGEGLVFLPLSLPLFFNGCEIVLQIYHAFLYC